METRSLCLLAQPFLAKRLLFWAFPALLSSVLPCRMLHLLLHLLLRVTLSAPQWTFFHLCSTEMRNWGTVEVKAGSLPHGGEERNSWRGKGRVLWGREVEEGSTGCGRGDSGGRKEKWILLLIMFIMLVPKDQLEMGFHFARHCTNGADSPCAKELTI